MTDNYPEMIKDISIGRYYPSDSFLHKTDPRVKAILYAVYLVAIFMIKEPVAILVLLGVIILQLIMGKITIPPFSPPEEFMLRH